MSEVIPEDEDRGGAGAIDAGDDRPADTAEGGSETAEGGSETDEGGTGADDGGPGSQNM